MARRIQYQQLAFVALVAVLPPITYFAAFDQTEIPSTNWQTAARYSVASATSGEAPFVPLVDTSVPAIEKWLSSAPVLIDKTKNQNYLEPTTISFVDYQPFVVAFNTFPDKWLPTIPASIDRTKNRSYLEPTTLAFVDSQPLVVAFNLYPDKWLPILPAFARSTPKNQYLAPSTFDLDIFPANGATFSANSNLYFMFQYPLSKMLGSPRLPTWNTAGRPSSPLAGNFGFNTQTSALEVYNGTAWVSTPLV